MIRYSMGTATRDVQDGSPDIIVGYALTEKKCRSLFSPELIEEARAKGVHFLPIDPARPIEDQVRPLPSCKVSLFDATPPPRFVGGQCHSRDGRNGHEPVRRLHSHSVTSLQCHDSNRSRFQSRLTITVALDTALFRCYVPDKVSDFPFQILFNLILHRLAIPSTWCFRRSPRLLRIRPCGTLGWKAMRLIFQTRTWWTCRARCGALRTGKPCWTPCAPWNR